MYTTNKLKVLLLLTLLTYIAPIAPSQDQTDPTISNLNWSIPSAITTPPQSPIRRPIPRTPGKDKAGSPQKTNVGQLSPSSRSFLMRSITDEMAPLDYSAESFLRFAKADLKSAILLNNNLMPKNIFSVRQLSNILFFAQQAAEKALKGCIFHLPSFDKLDKSHELVELATECPATAKLPDFISYARELEPYQNSPRYPDMPLAKNLEKLEVKFLEARKASNAQLLQEAQESAKEIANKAIKDAEKFVEAEDSRLLMSQKQEQTMLPEQKKWLTTTAQTGVMHRRNLFPIELSQSLSSPDKEPTPVLPENPDLMRYPAFSPESFYSDSPSISPNLMSPDSSSSRSSSATTPFFSSPYSSSFSPQSMGMQDLPSISNISPSRSSSVIRPRATIKTPRFAFDISSSSSSTKQSQEIMIEEAFQKWLNSAKNDIASAQILLASDEASAKINNSGILTLAQQAAEKALKALWIKLKIGSLTATHDIEKLATKIIHKQVEMKLTEQRLHEKHQRQQSTTPSRTPTPTRKHPTYEEKLLLADAPMQNILKHAATFENIYFKMRYPLPETIDINLTPQDAITIAKEVVDYVENYSF